MHPTPTPGTPARLHAHLVSPRHPPDPRGLLPAPRMSPPFGHASTPHRSIGERMAERLVSRGDSQTITCIASCFMLDGAEAACSQRYNLGPCRRPLMLHWTPHIKSKPFTQGRKRINGRVILSRSLADLMLDAVLRPSSVTVDTNKRRLAQPGLARSGVISASFILWRPVALRLQHRVKPLSAALVAPWHRGIVAPVAADATILLGRQPASSLDDLLQAPSVPGTVLSLSSKITWRVTLFSIF